MLAGAAGSVARVGGASVAVVGANAAALLFLIARARVGRAVAHFLEIALARSRPAHERIRAFGVARARGRRATTGFGEIAGSCRWTTRHARVASGVLASRTRAVAAVGGTRIAVVVAGRAIRFLLV